MDFTPGLNDFKDRVNDQLNKDVITLKNRFDNIRNDLRKYISSSGGAYKFLQSFDEKDEPNKDFEPEGFLYGYEVIPGLNPQEKLYFPLLYPFDKFAATAIEESIDCEPFLFNFALRSIISYPLGDSIVFMVDSNVSGQFNQLSEITTNMDDIGSKKPYFHYITKADEREKLLADLESIMDHNIRNYVSKYDSVHSYNIHNQSMHVPYRFVFIKDIVKTLQDKNQIDRLSNLISSDNATKAGIYIFYTYNKNEIKDGPESYYADSFTALRKLLSLSHVVITPKQHYPSSKLQLDSIANTDVVDRVMKYVKTQNPPVTEMSFKEQIQKKLNAGSLWSPPFNREQSHLPIVVGFQNAVTPKVVDVQFKEISPHIFIGGKIGSGKSILLHNFIINGALRYSPEQLQFYLVDMKGGVSFAPYKQLPHVVALSASSSRHYAMSLLELFCEENERRLALFKRVGASNLDDYNEVMRNNGKNTLPFLFGIIDEFQVLFDNMDGISNKAEAKIKDIHKRARAAGIFLALCTQQAPGNVDRSQVDIKMSLVCSPNDSITLLGNDGAARLNGIGRAIINTHATGDAKYNQEFQVAFIHERKELPLYIEKIREIYLKQNGGTDKLDHFYYDDNDRAVRLSSSMNDTMRQQQDNSLPHIYLGVPGFFRKEHVKIWFHRDSQSNIAMVGNDRPAALRLTGIIAIQFMRAYKKTGAKVYISDLQKTTEPTFGKLQFLSEEQGVSCSESLDLKRTMKEVYQILCDRKGNPVESAHEPEVLYAILDLKPDNNFSAASRGRYSIDDDPVEKSIKDMLCELIDEGPDYGIHILAYSFNYSNMESLLTFYNDSLMHKMEIKVALRGGNSSKLLNIIGTGDVVNVFGEAVIKMPVEMGLRSNGDNDLGDPFRIYDTLDDQRLLGSVWDTLFKNLPNKQL